MKEQMQFKTRIQYLVPQRWLSKCLGAIANCRMPFIKNAFIRFFIWCYNVDLTLAQREQVNDYHSFNDFFTRRLKASKRPIEKDSHFILSPIDGTLSEFGPIFDGQLIQAKGLIYKLDQLLGGNEFINDFNQGFSFTLYLSPKDYHRVHMPLDGRLLKMIGIPGTLFSVNQTTSEEIPNLYTKNERVVCVFETSVGKMAVIFVGAMIVSGIHTAWAGRVNRGLTEKKEWDYNRETLNFSQGEEIGHFELGSTVILLFAPNTVQSNNLDKKSTICYGEKLADVVS